MRRPVDMLLLPGPGRATRHLRVTRAKLWGLTCAGLLLSLVAVAGGFVAADYLLGLGGLPAWASL